MDGGERATRVWYQSFTDTRAHAAYTDRLAAYLAEITSDGVAVRVAGMTPPDMAVHRLTEMRCALQAVDLAVQAQEEGYDAVVVGHFQDSGLHEARCAVDIPVIGLGEASILHAMQLGRSFGLVTIDALFAEWHREQVARIGLADRLAGIVSLATPPAELVAAFDDPRAYERLLARFRAQAQSLVDAGAEVVIPAGGLFGLMSARERRFRVGEAVVLNPLPIALRAAELAVWLQREQGVGASRAGVYAKAPRQAIDELRGLVRGAYSAAAEAP